MGRGSDVESTGFRKASDTLSNQKLIHTAYDKLLSKLYACGVHGHRVDLKMIPEQTKMSVSEWCHHATSEWSPVKNGIPHGPLLGTILFLVFLFLIRDLTDVINNYRIYTRCTLI